MSSPPEIAAIQAKFMAKLESKLQHGKSLSPTQLKKTLNFFDTDSDGWISFEQFLQCANGKIETEEAELLFMWWDTLAGEQQPCGSAAIDYAVHDLLNSQPQYSTLLKGEAPAVIAGRGRGNRSSQEGGIFGGGSYAAESERENLAARNRPVTAEAPTLAPAAPSTFRKPVNNESSIDGGIFGSGAPAQAPPPSGRTNRSNQSSIAGGIFNQEVEPQSSRRVGRNANASSIEGGIFG